MLSEWLEAFEFEFEFELEFEFEFELELEFEFEFEFCEVHDQFSWSDSWSCQCKAPGVDGVDTKACAVVGVPNVNSIRGAKKRQLPANPRFPGWMVFRAAQAAVALNI